MSYCYNTDSNTVMIITGEFEPPTYANVQKSLGKSCSLCSGQARFRINRVAYKSRETVIAVLMLLGHLLIDIEAKIT